MRHLPGQAVRSVWVVAHRLLTLGLTVIVLAAAATGLLAWRLSEGPLDLDWLARKLEAAANASSEADGGRTHLAIGGAALVWEGFRDGVDRPLDIRLRDIIATDMAGTTVFAIPSAEISLSLSALVLGRIEPRAIELHGARLRAERAEDGAMRIDLGGLTDVGAEDLPAPPDPAPRNGGIVSILLGELDVDRFRGQAEVLR